MLKIAILMVLLGADNLYPTVPAGSHNKPQIEKSGAFLFWFNTDCINLRMNINEHQMILILGAWQY